MSTQIKFIPCSEDEQIYHYHRTTKKAHQLNLNVVDFSKKNKDMKPGKGMPPKKKVKQQPPSRKGKK